MSKNWYAVYVHSRREKKVSILLDQKQIENYLPLQKVVKQWSDRKKTIEEPLFKSYIFANIEENEKEDIRQTPGVMNFVYWLGKPAIIRNEEIEAIKSFINQYDDISVENNDFKIGGDIKIANGPFMNQTGKIKSIKKNKVRIFIESLGCYLIADITKNKVLNLPAIK